MNRLLIQLRVTLMFIITILFITSCSDFSEEELQESALEKEIRVRKQLLSKLENSMRKDLMGEWAYTRDWCDLGPKGSQGEDIPVWLHANIKFKQNGLFEEIRKILIESGDNIILKFNYFASGNYNYKSGDLNIKRINETIQPGNEAAINFMESLNIVSNDTIDAELQILDLVRIHKDTLKLNGNVWIPIPFDREGKKIENFNEIYSEDITLYRK